MVTKVGTHPQFGWDYSYIILQGIPAEVRILRTNAQDANLVADHMMATAAGTRPACSQETVRLALTAQFTLMSVACSLCSTHTGNKPSSGPHNCAWCTQ